ncbi:hypothetical protein [Cutibacterium porci]|uniref:hypothetical protein n=1 Tax=Cutibacterium porci TaxID=2605781 RepID=UPI0012B3BF4F|nr:hypothetical protein [Cutibacterium porci]
MVPYKSPLGYKKGLDGNLVIGKERAPVVREIYGLFLAGKSVRKIKDVSRPKGI